MGAFKIPAIIIGAIITFICILAIRDKDFDFGGVIFLFIGVSLLLGGLFG